MMIRFSRIKWLHIESVRNFSSTPSLFNESDNSNDDKKKKAKSKLENLLIQMATNPPDEKNSKIKISQPVKQVREQRPIHKIDLKKVTDKHTAKLISAVKDVADEIGDVKNTESELLHVILNNKRPGGSATEEPQNLQSVISNMQIEKDETRAAQVRRHLDPAKKPRVRRPRAEGDRVDAPVNIFGHSPLGIFPDGFVPDAQPYETETWSKMAQRELKLLVTHPPRNIFEEMIAWTERGKLWHFPIDNEQGMDSEKSIDFTQHVFLEEHLEGWCPQKGPIRHFMDLVLVGLSKNPYITVQAKVDHIHWFRDYFESKKTLLESTGAIPTESSPTATP